RHVALFASLDLLESQHSWRTIPCNRVGSGVDAYVSRDDPMVGHVVWQARGWGGAVRIPVEVPAEDVGVGVMRSGFGVAWPILVALLTLGLAPMLLLNFA